MNEKEYYFSAEQISNGVVLCLENASKLIEEAEILFNKKRYARALSLAILSLEELGKIPMLVGAIHIVKSDKKRIKNFHKGFKSHIAKREDTVIPFFAELFLNIKLGKINEIEKFKSLELEVDKIPNEIKEFLLEEKNIEKLKLMGFYVDYSEPEFTSPNIVDRKISFYFLGESKVILKKYNEHLGDLERDELIEMIKMSRGKKYRKFIEDEFIPLLKSVYKKMGTDISDDLIKKLKEYWGYKK